MGVNRGKPSVSKNRNQFEEFQNFISRILNAKYMFEEVKKSAT